MLGEQRARAGASVQCPRSTAYCCGVKVFRHCSSDFSTANRSFVISSRPIFEPHVRLRQASVTTDSSV